MNFGPKSLRSVDIRCSDNSFNDYYAHMVHEMAHSWDFYYATKLGSNISSQNDIINLYDKYKSTWKLLWLTPYSANSRMPPSTDPQMKSSE